MVKCVVTYSQVQNVETAHDKMYSYITQSARCEDCI